MPVRGVISEEIENYVSAVITRQTAVQQRLRAATARLPDRLAKMQIGPDHAAFFGLLVRMLGARRALEIGTFTGYSALAVAAALPDDGKLVACDISEEWTGIGRRHWEEAGVAHKIDLRLAPAMDTLRAMLSNGERESFDFAFIDADKANYDNYYEASLQLVRQGGLIALDNVLWSGAVVDPAEQDEDTRALRAINEKIRDDKRVEAALLTIGDGVMLARKK